MNKKGASKFINTVLLVVFVIALLIIVFLWSKNYLEELAQKRGAIAKKELECQDAEVSIYDFAQTGPGNLSITMENKGTKKIYKFTIRVIGTKDTQSIEKIGVLDSSEMKKFENLIFVEEEVGEIQKIEVIPWLKVAAGKYIPCKKQKVGRAINQNI